MQYTIVFDANQRGGFLATIHRKGCRDIARDLNPAAFTVSVTGTLREAKDVAVDPDDRALGYTDEHIKVYGCAK